MYNAWIKPTPSFSYSGLPIVGHWFGVSALHTHVTLTRHWFNAGPASLTLDQHRTSIEFMCIFFHLDLSQSLRRCCKITIVWCAFPSVALQITSLCLQSLWRHCDFYSINVNNLQSCLWFVQILFFQSSADIVKDVCSLISTQCYVNVWPQRLRLGPELNWCWDDISCRVNNWSYWSFDWSLW